MYRHSSRIKLNSVFRYISSRVSRNDFPVIDGTLQPKFRRVFEVNLRNSQICHQRYQEHWDKVLKGGGQNAVTRHTQENQKILVRERIRMLLDEEDYLELSPFAGLGLPYGDIPGAACLTGLVIKPRERGADMSRKVQELKCRGEVRYQICSERQLLASNK